MRCKRRLKKFWQIFPKEMELRKIFPQKWDLKKIFPKMRLRTILEETRLGKIFQKQKLYELRINLSTAMALSPLKPLPPLKQQKTEDERCCVCLVASNGLPVTSCCGQSIHRVCLDSALKRYTHCPYCRWTMHTVSSYFFLFSLTLTLYWPCHSICFCFSLEPC